MEPPYWHQSPTRRLPRPILVFWLAGLRALVGKMALLITIVTGGPAHVSIFPTCWLVAATIISSRGLGCVDPSGRGGALRPGAAGATIATISIVPTLLMVPARSLQGLSSLGTMRRHGLCLLGAERKGVSVPSVVLGRFQGGAVASVGFKAEPWSRRQQAFISRTHKERFRAALASAVIAFLMAWSQVFF